MPTPVDFLLGVVLPAVIAAVLLLLARRESWGPGAGAALAAGGAYVAGHVLQRGWRGWPPAEAADWPLACAALGTVVGATGLTRRGPGALRLALRLVACGFAAWLVLSTWRARVEAQEARLAIGLVAAVGAAAWSLLELRQAAPGWWTPTLLALTAAGAATAIGLSGSVKLALMAGALSAVMSACAVAAALRLGPPAPDGATAPFALVLLALVVAANRTSDLPVASAALIAAAPGSALLPRSALGARASAPRASAGLVLLPLALLGLAVKLAVDASPGWDGL